VDLTSIYVIIVPNCLNMVTTKKQVCFIVIIEKTVVLTRKGLLTDGYAHRNPDHGVLRHRGGRVPPVRNSFPVVHQS
jgi:hypothetical protein